MLACICLAEHYSIATVLSLLRRLQLDRGTMNLTMARTVQSKDDLEKVSLLFLEMLCAAQHDLLPPKKGFARLPLRLVQTKDLQLVVAHKKNREVYRMHDGGILKTVAAKGLLGRACSVYEAVSAAFEAGAAIARPHELVRTESGYATVLDFVDGPSLGELVTEGHVTPQEAGRMMAQCLRELHALHGDKDRMRDIREPFLRIVDNLAPWLTKRTSKICRNTISNIQ